MKARNTFRNVLCAAMLALAVIGLAASAPVTQAAPSGPNPSANDPVICQVTSPNPDAISVLSAVSAVPDTAQMRADIVWAVGYSKSNQHLDPMARTLTMRDEGTGWKVLSSPNLPGNNYLTAVAARTQDEVWAVGYVATNGAEQPIAMRYNGVQWKYVLTPEMGITGFGRLNGVVTISDKEAVAVGYKTGPMMSAQPLVLYYDGTVWSELKSEAIEPNSRITSVAGTSLKDLWVAATLGDEETGMLSLLYRYDSVNWALVSKASGSLVSLASTEGRVWAVGNAQDTAKNKETLAMAYDKSGGQIDRIKTINRDVDHNFLTAVVADGTEVYAVGYTGKPENQTDFYTLVLRFDGQTFVPLDSPSPTNLDRLFGATLSNGNLWAVGDSRLWFQSPNDLNTSTLILSTMCVPSQPPTPTPRPMTFTDVKPSDYFQQAVAYLYGKGVVSGYADNTFRPYNYTTRAQLAKIIVLAEEWPIYTEGGPHFTDVPKSDTFYKYIETAYSRGVISGYADGTFHPMANVTRGQLTKIVVLAEGWAVNTVGGPHFSDVPVTNPFYPYVETAYNAVIISGYVDGTFGLGNPATRGQISKVVYQAVVKP